MKGIHAGRLPLQFAGNEQSSKHSWVYLEERMATHTIDQPFMLPADAGSNTGEKKTESNMQQTQGARHLPAVLGMRDLTVLLILIVLFVPNLLSAQLAGPASFLY